MKTFNSRFSRIKDIAVERLTVYNSLDKEYLAFLFDILSCGVAVATDVSCRQILHNYTGSKILRINMWENFSHSNPKPPPVKIVKKGRILLPKEMPIQRAVWLGKKFINDELDFIWEDGVRKVIKCIASPFYDNDGVITGAIAIYEDITERKNRGKYILTSQTKRSK